LEALINDICLCNFNTHLSNTNKFDSNAALDLQLRQITITLSEIENQCFKPSPAVHSARPQRCYPTFIGGSDLEEGTSQNAVVPKSCSSLKCGSCENPVVRILNSRWKQAHLDYLFFRNNASNLEQLKKVRFYTIYIAA
jgi:hypothetical protein